MKCIVCIEQTEHLFISAQGLGKIIKNLEHEYNTTFSFALKMVLFLQIVQKLFYDWSKELVLQDAHIKTEINNLNNGINRLRIGCASGILKAIQLKTILDFANSNKTLHVEWSEYSNEEVINKLLNYDIEYGIVVGLHDYPNLEQVKLCQCNLVLYVYEGHPYYEKEKIPLDMLRDENIIIMNESFHIYNDFIKACKIKGVYSKHKSKNHGWQPLMHLCRQKIGIAISPKFEDEAPAGLKGNCI